jgi:stage V sporulation protein SpoVS
MLGNIAILKIGAGKDPGYAKRVAGAMTWQLRERGMFLVRAVKSRAVSIAVSSVATCNKRISAANVVLGIEPSFFETERKTMAIEMLVKEVDPERPAEILEYRVSGKRRHDRSLTEKLSQALLGPVLHGKGIAMKCIGSVATCRAIEAVVMARGALNQETVLVPFWETIIEEDGSNTSVLSLEFWARTGNR